MNIKNKNVILLINSFGGGGAERQFSILCKYLPFQKIICLEKENVYVDESEYPISYLSNHNSSTSSFYKYFYVFVYAFKLFKILKDEKNPIIISVLERSHLTILIVSYFLKIQHIMSFQVSHVSHYNNLLGRVLKVMFSIAVKKSKYCVSNSFAAVSEIIELYNAPSSKVLAIPNGYDFDEIATRSEMSEEIEKEYPSLLKQEYILCVARFFKQKAQDQLIISFRKVKEQHPTIQLVFAGVGEKMNDCIELAQRLELKTFVVGQNEFRLNYDVYFLGFQKNPLVLMKHAKIFAFPTYYEGLPNALIEAMICGTVPISSDCPTGPREIIAPNSLSTKVTKEFEVCDYGILIQPFNIHSPQVVQNNWIGSIMHLLENPVEYNRLKENIISGIVKYKISRIEEEWNKLLESI